MGGLMTGLELAQYYDEQGRKNQAELMGLSQIVGSIFNSERNNEWRREELALKRENELEDARAKALAEQTEYENALYDQVLRGLISQEQYKELSGRTNKNSIDYKQNREYREKLSKGMANTRAIGKSPQKMSPSELLNNIHLVQHEDGQGNKILSTGTGNKVSPNQSTLGREVYNSAGNKSIQKVPYNNQTLERVRAGLLKQFKDPKIVNSYLDKISANKDGYAQFPINDSEVYSKAYGLGV